jgi:hypothetical protein
VLYNLYVGKDPRDLGYYYIPTDWVRVSGNVLCTPTKIECECPFMYYEKFSGSKYTEPEMIEYLFEFFTDLVFKGIVLNFAIKNESDFQMM